MKKFVLIVCGWLMIASLQARVLRVNNYDGSAPYSKVQNAVDAAAEGDTIMLDGSPYSYGDVTLDKRVVLVGNGYYLVTNDVVTESIPDAIVGNITVNVEGCVIKSLNISGDVTQGKIRINAPKVIINRCYLSNSDFSIVMGEGADNCIISQSRICGPIGNSYVMTYNHQITNNMLNNMNVRGIHNSYVAYNTSLSAWGDVVYWSTGNKIERNHVYNENFGVGDNDNAYVDNYTTGDLFRNASSVLEIKNMSLPDDAKGKGCFAGSDPFVISGVPTGPMIEELDVPTSAEAGGTMTVSVKIGESR